MLSKNTFRKEKIFLQEKWMLGIGAAYGQAFRIEGPVSIFNYVRTVGASLIINRRNKQCKQTYRNSIWVFGNDSFRFL